MNEITDVEAVLTYYSLLDIEEDATPAEVRKAYLKKAAECHPDKHPDDPSATERFQALSEAYECLKDPTARRDYDTKLRQIRLNPPGLGEGEQHVYRSDSPLSHSPHHHHSHHHHDGSHSHDHHFTPRFTFFRSSGFFPFPPPPHWLGRNIPSPLAAFMDLVGSLPLPGPMRHLHERRHWPFGDHRPKVNVPPLMDPFDHPFFRQPMPSFIPPLQAPPPHLRRPYPPPHRPYPVARAAPIPPIPIPIPVPTPPNVIQRGIPIPGRHHSATYEIKDATGRTTGFVSHSSSSWSLGMR